MDRKQLVKLVADMYRFSKDNQIFLHSRFGIGKDLLEPYKKTIDECMYLDLCSKETIQISKAEKTISNYTKAAGDILGEVELMVYFVECGNNFTIGFGDIDEEFYNSLNEMYRRAINKVLSLPENQQKEFQDRLKEIMISSSDIGWCYHDTLSNDYYDAFSEEEES
ncbi:MAG: hypothetical protein KAR40_13345 [Candidatus Sabulitectum sp.]|nr:hypothetical protein [Candidatus Sabulitectum sp.]